MMKDYNDLLVAGIDIASLQTVPLDVEVLKIELDNLNNKQAEYKKASNLCRTVKDEMVKSDIAELLSKRWDKPLDEVKSYLKVDTKGADERLALADNVEVAFQKFDEYYKEGTSNLGFKSIDESFGGIRTTDVIGLAGYSNHGKSFIAIKIVTYRLVREKNNVLFFTQEMPAGQVMQYICQDILHMNEWTFLEHVKTEQGHQDLLKIKDMLGDRLRIVEQSGQTMDDVASMTALLNNSGWHVDFTVYDNFQLIPNVSDFSVYEAQAAKMKRYTNQYKCPLLMLVQMNDEFQQRGSKKLRPPVPGDIKGPNSFMSSLDELLMIWRPSLMQVNVDAIEAEEEKYITMMKIGKARRSMNGPTIFRYEYDPKTTDLKEVPLLMRKG